MWACRRWSIRGWCCGMCRTNGTQPPAVSSQVRGMPHSNRCEFLLIDHGIAEDVYVGPSGDLVAGARATPGGAGRQALVVKQDISRVWCLSANVQAQEARIAALRAEIELERVDTAMTTGQDQKRVRVLAGDKVIMARLRQSDDASENSRKGKEENLS